MAYGKTNGKRINKLFKNDRTHKIHKKSFFLRKFVFFTKFDRKIDGTGIASVNIMK